MAIATESGSILNHATNLNMIKKLITLAAGALFSMNASAGYLQYTISPSFTGGTAGVMVIREEDKSLAFFNISSPFGRYSPQEPGDTYHRNQIIETTTSFTGAGPTNIYMRDIMQEEYSAQVWLMFSSGSQPGMFNYQMRVLSQAGPQAPYPLLSPTRDFTFTGTATAVPLDAFWGPFMTANPDFIPVRDVPYYDPTQVPEPGSLALLAVGAAGFASLRRRRSKK